MTHTYTMNDQQQQAAKQVDELLERALGDEKALEAGEAEINALESQIETVSKEAQKLDAESDELFKALSENE